MQEKRDGNYQNNELPPLFLYISSLLFSKQTIVIACKVLISIHHFFLYQRIDVAAISIPFHRRIPFDVITLLGQLHHAAFNQISREADIRHTGHYTLGSNSDGRIFARHPSFAQRECFQITTCKLTGGIVYIQHFYTITAWNGNRSRITFYL